MGTRADFYLRKEQQLTWLGSIAWDGYSIDNVGKAKTEKQYLSRLKTLLEGREDGTFPKNGWPWPWKNSKLTDEIWVFNCDDNSIYRGFKDTGEYKDHTTPYLFTKGEKQIGYDDNGEEVDVDESLILSLLLPDMSDIANVTMGKRSGLIVIGY